MGCLKYLDQGDSATPADLRITLLPLTACLLNSFLPSQEFLRETSEVLVPILQVGELRLRGTKGTMPPRRDLSPVSKSLPHWGDPSQDPRGGETAGGISHLRTLSTAGISTKAGGEGGAGGSCGLFPARRRISAKLDLVTGHSEFQEARQALTAVSPRPGEGPSPPVPP